MDKKKRCKHEYGWCAVEAKHIFIFPNGFVEVGFSKRNKILFQCNHPNCNKVRNGYIKSKIKFGKIRKLTKEERR